MSGNGLLCERGQGRGDTRSSAVGSGAPSVGQVAAKLLSQRVGLLVLYLSWGSTYPAMRIALRTLPPISLQAARCLLAVLPLVLLARWFGAAWPTARQWRGSLLIGTIVLGGGHGLTAWAVVQTSGGLAALLVSMVSVWMVVLSWLVLDQRPTRSVLIGIAVGLLGLVLITGTAGAGLSGGPLLALLASPLCWAAGSVLSLRAELPGDPLMTTAAQLLAVVPVFLVVAALVGETAAWTTLPTAEAGLALLYLALVGYVLGFAVYTWLIRVSLLSTVSTYAFANPLVAVVLGWLLLGERLTPELLAGGALVLVGVALSVRQLPSVTAIPEPPVAPVEPVEPQIEPERSRLPARSEVHHDDEVRAQA
jgi:drug/metabolite transporter (DMT)-like permease